MEESEVQTKRMIVSSLVLSGLVSQGMVSVVHNQGSGVIKKAVELADALIAEVDRTDPSGSADGEEPVLAV